MIFSLFFETDNTHSLTFIIQVFHIAPPFLKKQSTSNSMARQQCEVTFRTIRRKASIVFPSHPSIPYSIGCTQMARAEKILSGSWWLYSCWCGLSAVEEVPEMLLHVKLLFSVSKIAAEKKSSIPIFNRA